MKWAILITILSVGTFAACQEQPNTKSPVSKRDTSITTRNSYSELFFDSAGLEHFIRTEKVHDSVAVRMRAFYNSRNFQYAWFFKEGIADYASTFLHIEDDYIGYSGDSLLYNPQLNQLVDSISNEQQTGMNAGGHLTTELMLTREFFRYAYRAYQGRGMLNTRDLGWFIPRKKIDMPGLLDSFYTNRGKNLSQYEPVNRQYSLLKEFLLKSYTLEKNGDLPFIKADKKNYKPGDSALAIVSIKRRLFLVEDLAVDDSTPVFTPELSDAVKSFQHRYGFTESGIIDKQLIDEMNRPISFRIRQILINMERLRWSPDVPASDFLLVNIPEFRLHVYEKGNYQWNMRIVVGSPAHNTVIFTGALKYIVFSPYWNIPPGIMKNETLPALKRDKNYLAKHNMEWHGKIIRQKPGPNNSLGLVKFLFPNSYNIYLHDTPSKSLFGEDQRAFSHGCIRLAEPAKLAAFLLRNDKNWNQDKIRKAMNSRKEQFVKVKDTVPVYIGYFTAWVDRQGKLNFRDDVYGHDRKMADRLFAGK